MFREDSVWYQRVKENVVSEATATGHIPREPLDWRVQSKMTTLTSWHVLPGILR